MNLKGIRERAESYLQDDTNKRWSDKELNQFISDSHVEFVRLSGHPQAVAAVDLISGTAGSGVAIAVDGLTVTATQTGHGYSAGDAIRIDGASNDEYNSSWVIDKKTDDTYTFRVPYGNTVTGTVSTIKLGPNYTRPASIAEVKSIALDGRELLIATESELNSHNRVYSASGNYIQGIFGTIMSPFSRVSFSVGTAPKWGDMIGPVKAAVFNNRTASIIRIFPIPYKDADIFEDENAAVKTSKQLVLRGTPESLNLLLMHLFLYLMNNGMNHSYGVA